MDRRAIAARTGLLAPPIALVGILLATLVDPSFSWTGSALSHTGELPPGRSVSIDLVLDRPSFLLFNGSLVATGAIGLPFAWLLYVEADHPLQRSGAMLLGLALVSLAAVGVFYLPHGLHAPAAIVHVIATMATLFVYGTGTVQHGEREYGLATIGLGLVTLGIWLLWTMALPDSGIAIPEYVGALALGGWTIWTALRTIETAEGVGALAESSPDR